jgi:hypothetical protein
LASIEQGAQKNVKSDWLAQTGDAVIRNKPSLSKVAISGDYLDLSNRPETTQVQSDWLQTDATQPDFIKNKPEIQTGWLPVGGLAGQVLKKSSSEDFDAAWGYDNDTRALQYIGMMGNLHTDNKETIVDAINELHDDPETFTPVEEDWLN